MSARRVPFLIATLGVILTAVLGGEAVALASAGELTLLFGVSALTTAPFLLMCLLGPLWLVRSDLPVDRYARIGAWTAAGLVFFVGLNAVTILASNPESTAIIVGWLRWAEPLAPAPAWSSGASRAGPSTGPSWPSGRASAPTRPRPARNC